MRWYPREVWAGISGKLPVEDWWGPSVLVAAFRNERARLIGKSIVPIELALTRKSHIILIVYVYYVRFAQQAFSKSLVPRGDTVDSPSEGIQLTVYACVPESRRSRQK
jgi:hypothetical protein